MIEKIILKKSCVLDKMPTKNQLDFGEIALNYNAEHPFLSFKDSDGDIILGSVAKYNLQEDEVVFLYPIFKRDEQITDNNAKKISQ